MTDRSPFQIGPDGGGMSALLRANPAMWTVLAVNVIYFIVLELAGGSEDIEVLIKYGAKYGPDIADGQFWRLVTPVFMHIGFGHLLANSIPLLIFGGIVERSYGWRSFLAIYFTAGVGGNVASYAAGPNVGAGASGAVFGLLGAFSVFLYLNKSTFGSSARSSLAGLAFIISVQIVIGLTTTGVDNWAHLGGLVIGALVGTRLSPRPQLENTYGLNRRLLGSNPIIKQANFAVIGTAALTTFAALLLITIVVSRGDSERNRTLTDELTGKAITALLQQDFKGASSYARMALTADPNGNALGTLYLIKGLGESQQGEIDIAIRDLNQALEYGLDNPESRSLAEAELRRITGK